MKRLVMITACLLAITGCQNSDIYSGSVYTANQAKQVQQVYYGTITSIQNVKIQTNASSDGQSNNVLGTLAGGVLGGVLGNSIGGGHGKSIATVVGAIGGALAGDAVQNAASQTDALQIEVQPENSSTPIVVVQKAQQGEFYIGQRVRLITNGKTISISP